MSYQVIARKWRPQRFADMVGQEPIARTLKNAIIANRIAHAYLFVGPRGIGKTTTARIFAKAMNCLHPVDGEPCCQCSSCKAIANETSVDVIEIDAATHTQVEKARDLCEDVMHMPIASKYKIYIIDEVHMLSKSAWNALLKTIEEPPAHAKFIFATTEVNKVLPTVISRCQRFDLRRIKSADIAGRLRLICDTEKIRIADAALQVIARAADGGMRDAQSLLDQLISFFASGPEAEITEAQALSLFGLAATGDMELLVRAIVSNDRAAAVTAIHRFSDSGKNLETLYEEIIAWLRGILLCRIVDDPAEILEDSQEKIELYKHIAAEVNPGAVQRLMEQLSASSYLLRDAINKQVFMESILLKAMRIAHAVQIEDLIARLNQIRRDGELDALKSVVPIYEMPVGQIVVAKNSAYAPRTDRTQETEIASAESVKIAPPEKKTTLTGPEDPPSAPVGETGTENTLESAPEDVAENMPETAPEDMAENTPESAPEDMAENTPESIPEDTADAELDDVPPVCGPAPGDLVISDSSDLEPAALDAVAPGDPLPVADAKNSELTAEQLWQNLILDMRDHLKKDFLAAAMTDGTPLALEHGRLVVGFDLDYESFQYLTTEQEYPLLSRRLRDLAGTGLALCRQPGLATPAQLRRREDVENLKRKAAGSPLVREAVKLFSGRLADAHDLTDGSEK